MSNLSNLIIMAVAITVACITIATLYIRSQTNTTNNQDKAFSLSDITKETNMTTTQIVEQAALSNKGADHAGQFCAEWILQTGNDPVAFRTTLDMGEREFADFLDGKHKPSTAQCLALEKITGIQSGIWANY